MEYSSKGKYFHEHNMFFKYIMQLYRANNVYINDLYFLNNKMKSLCNL